MAYKKGRHGLGFKAWSMCRKSWSLVFPFAVGYLNKMFPVGQEFEQTNLQKFKCPGKLPRGDVEA